MINIRYYDPEKNEVIVPKSKDLYHMIIYSRYVDENGGNLFTGSIIKREYDDYITQIVWEDDCIGAYIAGNFLTLREMSNRNDVINGWESIGSIYTTPELLIK